MRFKLGQKVAAYSTTGRVVGLIQGINTDDSTMRIIIARGDGYGGSHIVHEKQCRLIKEKPAKKSFYINPEIFNESIIHQDHRKSYIRLEGDNVVGWIRLVEKK